MGHVTHRRCSQSPMVMMTMLLFLRKNYMISCITDNTWRDNFSRNHIMHPSWYLRGGKGSMRKQRWAAAVLGGCDPHVWA